MLFVILVGYPPFYGEREDEVKREVLLRNYDFNGKFSLGITC